MATRHRFAALSFTVALALAGVLALLWLLGGSTPSAHADSPHYVAPDCTGVPVPCHTTIQEAVDAAVSGDEIRVATGDYTGVQTRTAPAGYDGPTVVTQVVYISKTVTIRGGYTTAFSDPPDPEANQTTLDAQREGRVLFISGDISPTIEGLRFTGGDAAGLGGHPPSAVDAGGGVYVISATATIRDNQVFSNTADNRGGGVYVISATATIRDNRVFSNTADLRGGGLHLEGSDATLSGNTIISNTAGNGGGLCMRYSAATLSGNTVTANTAGGGGGLRLTYSDATLNGNTISSNTATAADGGGLFLTGVDATFSGNTISSNTANDDGGGLNLRENSVAIFSGNTIISNTANGWDSYGGGLRLKESDATLINNVVADNQATFGAGICVERGSARLLHTTIARNSGGDGVGVYVITSGGGNDSTVALTNTILVSHSVGINVTAGNTATLESTLWQGNTADEGGAGMINRSNDYTGDPRFDADGYHLTVSSAAIDKGVDAGVTTDIDGDSRPQGSAPDLGADEMDVTTIYLPIIMKNY